MANDKCSIISDILVLLGGLSIAFLPVLFLSLKPEQPGLTVPLVFEISFAVILLVLIIYIIFRGFDFGNYKNFCRIELTLVLGFTAVLIYTITDVLEEYYSYPGSLETFLEEGMLLSGGILLFVAVRQIIDTLEKQSSNLTEKTQQLSAEVQDRKQVEEEVRKQKNRYRAIANNYTDAVCRWLPDTTLTFANDEYLEIFGLEESEIGNVKWQKFLPEEARAETLTFYENLNRQTPPPLNDYEHKVTLPDGKTRDYHWVDNPILDASGNLIEWQSVGRDITDQKQREQELRVKDNAIESAFNGIVISDSDANIFYVNDAFVDMFGFENKEDAIGIHPLDLHPEVEHQKVKKSLDIIREKGALKKEFKALKKNGELFDVQINATRVRDEDGNVTCMMASFEDITERKQFEYTLKRTQELANVGSWHLKIPENNLVWSDEVYRIFGLEPQQFEATYESFLDHVHPEDQGKVDEVYTSSIEKGRNEYEVDHRIIRGETGEVRYVHEKGQHLKDYEGEIVESIGMIQDITNRKEREEELRAANQHLEAYNQQLEATEQQLSAEVEERKHAEKKLENSLRQKETLLKEVHHRVKNNMQIISSMLMLQSRYVEDERLAEIVKECNSRIRSMALVHEQLYRSTDLSSINFRDYVEELVNTVFSTYDGLAVGVKRSINVEEVNLDIDTCIPCGLILQELVSNSLQHAFEDGKKGQLEIDFHLVKEKNEPPIYKLKVTDTGCGLPEDIDIENAESLGLVLVHSLVEGNLQGDIEIDTQKGTSFKITFPAQGEV